MIDHVGFPVSDYARSKAFYAQALAPLGYGLVWKSTARKRKAGLPRQGSAMPASRTSGLAAKAD